MAEVIDLGVFGGPLFTVDAVVAAEEPGVADEDVDENAGLRGDGMVLPVELLDELVEFFLGFAADDEGFGVESGFERIHARGGLARGGAGAGTVLRVSGVSGVPLCGDHEGLSEGIGQVERPPYIQGSRGAGNFRDPNIRN